MQTSVFTVSKVKFYAIVTVSHIYIYIYPEVEPLEKEFK